MAKNLKALIIGAGSIGGLIDSPKTDAIASHAHAYSICPDTHLIAICEPYEPNALAFMERWGAVKHYKSVHDICKDKIFNIASIASTTTQHADDILTLLKRPDCTYILCEKPLVATEEELNMLKDELQHTNKKVLVHLMRRYNPSFIHLANRIHYKEFGKSLGFHGICTKGLLHNGSHLLGVLSHFFGTVTSLEPIHPFTAFDVTLTSAQGTINILRECKYSLFELTLWFEKGVIKILEGGEKIEIYTEIPSPLYEGYLTLILSETVATYLSRYALDSLEFLLNESNETCKAILTEHLHLHQMIFQTLKKEGTV